MTAFNLQLPGSTHIVLAVHHCLGPNVGLFSRAISQSGSVAISKGYNTTPLQGVQELGEKLNCTDVMNTRKLHECLIAADPVDIATQYFDIMDLPELTKEFTPLDGDVSEVFFEDYPINLLVNGSFQRVPWLAGSNNAEGYAGVHGNFVIWTG